MTIQEMMKLQPSARVEYKGRWMRWIEDGRWVVKEWHNDLDGTRRIETLVRTPDEAEALRVLMHGKAESEEGK